MIDKPAIPSSVDMSGDLSSKRRLTPDTKHRAEVGEPIGGKDWRAGMRGEQQEGLRSDPVDCALILGTPVTGTKEIEYRIGQFKSHTQLKAGLSDPMVVRACFGDSDIYMSRNEAMGAVSQTYPKSEGIKVMRRPQAYAVMTFR